MRIEGKIIHIAGSASVKSTASLIDYGHKLIRDMVNKLFSEGARFLIQVGKEDYTGTNKTDIPLIFDWTVMSEIYDCLRSNELIFESSSEKPIITVVKQDFTESLPPQRRGLWKDLLERGAVQIEFLEEGWASGAVRRIRMSEIGDLLIILSGGEGVEHLAEEYNRLHKPIIPLDLNLGSSKGDGSGGAITLFSKMLQRSEPYMTLENQSSAGELFLSIRTNNGKNPIDKVTEGIVRLINNIIPPIAFYVRLLAKEAEEYRDVEDYFRNIVDPFIEQHGFSIKEMGRGESSHAWMNAEIFESLHKAAIVVVDITGLRPNCFMELGYALGRPLKVILTAKKGAKLPFDTEMYECLFWDPLDSMELRRSDLSKYYERNHNRPPIVKNRDAL